MPVDSQHPLYERHEKMAGRVRDAVAGADAIKAAGTRYLPNPDADDLDRYDALRKRAVWFGVTGRTHDGMLGAVFRRSPSVELPPRIEPMMRDADGNGMPLEQLARLITSQLLKNGRHGLLTDYPPAPEGATAEQTAGLLPQISSYHSQDIINWRVEDNRLVMVVLREHYDDPVDEFESEIEEQHRVLRLEDGAYTQQVYRNGEPHGEKMTPRDGRGRTFDHIPFQFLGAINNDETPDKPLLLDIADLNIAHYVNSADLEESSHLAGQPMFHIDIGTMTTEEWKELNPNGIKVGVRRGIQTQGGTANLIQAREHQLPDKLMERKEAQMLALGARLIEQSGGAKTAEEILARAGAENANLSTLATNASRGILAALRDAALFMNDNPDTVAFQLNQEFYERGAEPQMVMARIQEVDRGLIATKDYRDWRRKTGGIAEDRTDEEIDADIEVAGGAAL